MSELGTKQIRLEIQGMTCDACAVHVSQALRETKGVLDVQIPSWSSGRASLTAKAEVKEEDLIQSVTNAGYHASVRSLADSTPGPRKGEWPQDAEYDLVVIGTGGAGMGAAIKAAELNRSVCVIEAGTIGGTCVNIGCVPSKALIRAAEAFFKAGHHPFVGVHTKAEGLDWSEVIRQKDELVGSLRQKKYVDVIASYGDRVTLLQGRARLQPNGVVELDNGKRCKAGKVVIATGARPTIPRLDGIERVEVLTSTSVMDLQKQPHSLLVIGGRAIALELGQAFARFGTRVTILQRSARLIPEHEPEISDALAAYLREEGLTIHTGVTPVGIRQEGGEKVVLAHWNGQRQEFRAEQVLMAMGRTPNTQGMGLEEASVTLDPQGFVVVDDHMQTSHPHIYAAGDVTNRPKLVYVAAAAGGIAAENALNENHRTLDLSVLPDVIFTDPQVASVGLTEARAKEQRYATKISLLPLQYVPRALAARDTRGLIKLIADRNSDRLLGAHVLAAEGGEIIQTAALAVKFGIQYGFSATALSEILFPYLVQAEGLKLAALTFTKDVGKLSCCAG